MFTQMLFERDSLNATQVIPQSLNGTTNSGTIDMSRFNRCQFICLNAAAGGAIVSVLQQGNAQNGSDAANITNGTASVTNGANSMWTLEVAANQLTGRYVRLQMISTAAVIVSAVGVGTDARYAKANSYDSSNVTQRFTCTPYGQTYA